MRCVSFCPTESYRLAAIVGFFSAKGYNVKQYRKVLHISYAPKKGDIFIFCYGCLIAWGLNRNEEKQLLEQLKPFAINSLPAIEIGHFVYKYSNRT